MCVKHHSIWPQVNVNKEIFNFIISFELPSTSSFALACLQLSSYDATFLAAALLGVVHTKTIKIPSC